MPYATYSDLKRRKPLRWWHEAIIDDMIAFPTDPLRKRAERLGYSTSYLSIIINSDMFRSAYEARRREYTRRLDTSLVLKTAMAADRAMDIILETLEKKRDAIPFAQLSDFADKSLAKLGYGIKPAGPAVTLNVDNRSQTLSVSKEDLEQARNNLRAVERKRLLEQTPSLLTESESKEEAASGADVETESAAADGPTVEAPSDLRSVGRGALAELA